MEHAVLATYSADFVAVVTALLALSGADFDHRRRHRVLDSFHHRHRLWDLFKEQGKWPVK